MYLKTPIAVAIALSTSAIAFAEEGFRQHDAHVHGHVEFNMAQDGNELLVEITAPGADVVGFEHAPENQAQKETLAKAIETLNKASHILSIASNAGCKVEHVSVTHTLGEDDHDKHDHDKHDHDKHDHGHDHDKHDHDKHDHDHDHDKHDHDHDHDKHDHDHDHDKHDHDHDHDKHDHDHDHSGHGEFTIEYHFECQHIDQLSTIDVNWFKAFPNTESISANILTDKAQSAVKLTTDKTKISL